MCNKQKTQNAIWNVRGTQLTYISYPFVNHFHALWVHSLWLYETYLFIIPTGQCFALKDLKFNSFNNITAFYLTGEYPGESQNSVD